MSADLNVAIQDSSLNNGQRIFVNSSKSIEDIEILGAKTCDLDDAVLDD